jgi:hypothetical protein
MDKATQQSKLAAGKLIEVWHVSAYNGMDVETGTRVSGVNRTAAYDELLERKSKGEKFDPDRLTDEFRTRELNLLWSPVDVAGARNHRELSLRYYGEARYWPLIVWANAAAFPGQTTEDTILPPGQPLHVVHFLGWPQ